MGVAGPAVGEALVELGRHVGPIAPKADKVMKLVAKLEQRLESGEPLSGGDRDALRATILALEQGLA